MWYKPPKPLKKPNSRFYHYRWQLPEHLHALNDGKKYVSFSLETADEKEAQRKINREHERVLARFEAGQRSQAASSLAAVDRAVDKFFALGAEKFGSMDEFCYFAMLLLFFVEAAANANESQAPHVSAALGFEVNPLTFGETTNLDLGTAMTRHRVFEQTPLTRGLAMRETPQRLLASRCWAPAHQFLESIIPMSGYQWSVGSAGYDRAAEQFLTRLAEHRFESWPANLETALGVTPHETVRPIIPAVASTPVTTLATGSPSRHGEKRLSDLMDVWAKKVRPKPKSLDEAKRALRRFNELFGDLFISQIDKQMMLDFRDFLFTLPARPRHEIRNMALKDQVAAADAEKLPRLSAASVEKEFGAIRAMLGFAAGENMLPQNVAAGIRISYEKDFGDKRLAFSEGELTMIFADEPLVSSMDHFEELFWFNVLGPLTGLRIEEMAALRPQNIKQEQAIWYIAIERDPLLVRAEQAETGEDEKGAKNSNALRNVPIHPILLEMGFVELAKAREALGCDWLFPHLEADTFGNRSKESSRRLNRRFRLIGIKDREKVFHSHRHTMKRALRDDDRTKEEIADLLAGHSSNSVGRKYGKGAGLRTLDRAIRRLKYASVDWKPVVAMGQKRVAAARMEKLKRLSA